ncbi:MAG: MFS transporter [Anaerolineae bacterium]|jgi:DHA3 family tetracycline resistance protein-like MFS transporter
MRQRLDAFAVYIILQVSSSVFFSLIFTVDMVYHVTVVGLSPLQLVLVGTILEATVFLFEVPTGVLADVKSRRLSIIIGYLLIGLGFIIEGALPVFWTVALAQVVWGFGYTFTSGATQAWIVDEAGEERAGEAFLRGAQAGQVGRLVAIPLGIALGTISPAVPILIGGGLMISLAAFLALAMTEKGFAPAPRVDRSFWGPMMKTVKDARRLVGRQPLLLTVLGIGWFYGLYSEGFDRLWTPHLLENFSVPLVEGLDPVVWLGAVRGILLVICLAATEVARRRVDVSRSTPLARALMGNAAGIVLALVGFGLTRSFWLALVLYVAIGTLRSVRQPLHAAWFNQRIDDPQVRATMFSISGQVDAIGQIAGGPAVGAIGNRSVRAALVTAALLLTPVLPLYTVAIRRGERHLGKENV